jgi:hypothetical protein
MNPLGIRQIYWKSVSSSRTTPQGSCSIEISRMLVVVFIQYSVIGPALSKGLWIGEGNWKLRSVNLRLLWLLTLRGLNNG